MTRDRELSDQALDALFAEAQSEHMSLSGDLRARILQDALEIQSSSATTPAPSPKYEPDALKRLFHAIGGWAGFGGLVTATAAGIWIGFANPSFISSGETVTELSELSDDALYGDILPSDGLFFEEG